MFSCLEKMRGFTSTPIFNDFIVINGDLLKAGSSAMLTSFTPTSPLRIERLISPSVTGRPRALASIDSIFGRKLLMLMKKGSAIRITTTAATTIPAILRVRLLICIGLIVCFRPFKDGYPHSSAQLGEELARLQGRFCLFWGEVALFSQAITNSKGSRAICFILTFQGDGEVDVGTLQRDSRSGAVGEATRSFPSREQAWRSCTSR